MLKESQFSEDHPVVMITGGNSGIGFATATKLAQRGYHVILASRNQKTSAQAISRIRDTHPDASLESILLDLASFASVRQCASAFQEKGYPLHVLINNAGGSVPGEQASFSPDGYELTLATNHLGHFLLTNLLLDKLIQSAPSRVITVSSQLHVPGYGMGPAPDFDFDNLDGKKYYDSRVFYKNSKLANIWFTYELQRRFNNSGVTSLAVCPGFVPQAIGSRRTNPLERFLYLHIMTRMPFARSLDQASEAYLAVATDPCFANMGGRFIVDGEDTPSSEESYEEEKAKKLWELSRKWCGLDANQS
ncbi:MAG TPA: SDR family NAD(P)-dependent oxidoreductase [Anaerolineales bacterium]|nr:SDR family NAD(P)-dependent oxidoreductase [Anaerolineales bacterium]